MPVQLVQPAPLVHKAQPAKRVRKVTALQVLLVKEELLVL